MSSHKHSPWVGVLVGIALGLSVTGSSSLLAQPSSELHFISVELRHQSPAVRKEAANKLLRLVREGKVAGSEVGKLLKDPDDHVRQAVLSATLEAGNEAKYAVPVLVERLKDPDPEVRGRAVVALGRIGSEVRDAGPSLRNAAPLVVELLKDPDRFVRQAAAAQLASSFGFVTKDVTTPRLVELLEDSEGSVRLNAVKALGGMGAETRAAAPILIGYLKDSNKSMRRAAAVALGRIRPEARDAVPRLVELLKTDPAEDVCRAASEALRRIWPAAEHPVPELLKYMKDDDKRVRQVATESMGSVGPNARSAIPALTELLRDPDPDLRGSAVASLGYIAAGLWDVYEPDETTRHNLEKAREILEAHGEPVGPALVATNDIRNAIDRLEGFERTAQMYRNRGRLPVALLKSWKTWAIIVSAVGVLVIVAIRIAKRLRPGSQATTRPKDGSAER